MKKPEESKKLSAREVANSPEVLWSNNFSDFQSTLLPMKILQTAFFRITEVSVALLGKACCEESPNETYFC